MHIRCQCQEEAVIFVFFFFPILPGKKSNSRLAFKMLAKQFGIKCCVRWQLVFVFFKM